MSKQFWDNPTVILFILIGIVIVDSLWTCYLLVRQIRVILRTREVPYELRPFMAASVFENMRRHKIHKAFFEIVSIFLFAMIIGCLELYFGLYPLFWTAAKWVCYPSWAKHEIVVSIVFVILLSMYLMLKYLPMVLYEDHCLEKKQKKSDKRPRWLRILIPCLKRLGSIIVVVAFTAFLVFFVLTLGFYFVFVIYAASVIFTLLLLLLMPLIIGPLFGRQMKVPAGPLHDGIEKLTNSVGFPISKVRIVRTNEPGQLSNAFFFGCLCLKRIIIFDTMLLNKGMDPAKLAPEERGKGLTNNLVVAVVAHELGHWKFGHFYKGIIVVKVHLLITLLLFVLLFYHGPIYEAVGFESGLEPVIVGFIIIISYALVPYLAIANFFCLGITRHFEYQADAYAFELGFGRDLRLALLKLYADNLNFPIADKCYSAWNHTHPTMLERLNALSDLERQEAFANRYYDNLD